MKFIDRGVLVLEERERDGVRGHDRELSRWRCHIAPADFAQKDETEITARDIREWLRAMTQKESQGTGKRRKLSRQTINRCQSLVSAVFAKSVELELRDDNPSLNAKLRKRVDESDTEDKWAFLTKEEQDAFDACDAIPRPDRVMTLIPANTGIRQSEWRHLRIEDVILEEGNEHLRICVAGRRKKTGENLPPKSGKKRTVPLLPPALALMREWLAILPNYAPDNPENLVFPTRSGKLRQQGKPLGKSDTVRRYYQTAGIKLRPHLHWHALRHTFASNLVTGVYGRRWTLEEIRPVLGHSSISITERYAHLGEDAIKRAVRETVAASEIIAPAEEIIPADLVEVVEPPPDAEPAPPRPGLLGRVVGRLFGRVAREVRHAAS